MPTVTISEAEAARDLAGLLARVRAGEEIVIESGIAPAAILKSAPARHGRLLSESMAIADVHARSGKHQPVMDEDFAADMTEIIQNRKPAGRTAWD